MAIEQEPAKLPERHGPALSEEQKTEDRSQEAAMRRFEAALDKRGAKAAKDMGPVRVIRDGAENPLIAAANRVFQKASRRKVN